MSRKVTKSMLLTGGCALTSWPRVHLLSAHLFSATIIAEHRDSVCIIQPDFVPSESPPLPGFRHRVQCTERCDHIPCALCWLRSLQRRLYRRLVDVTNLCYRLCRFRPQDVARGLVDELDSSKRQPSPLSRSKRNKIYGSDGRHSMRPCL